MLTYPLTFPAFVAARMEPISRQSVAQSTSPFTGEQQTYVYPAQWWEFGVTLPTLFDEEGEEMLGFLLSLNGVQGTFLMRDFSYRTRRGVALGTPVVSGGGQEGNTLHVSGWNNNVSGQLLRGDQFQLGSGATARLHRVVSQVNSNSSGESDIEIWPSLRTSPSNGAALVLDNPVGVFRLASNDFTWSVTPGKEYEFQFGVREAL